MKDFYDHTYSNICSELEHKSTKVIILENPEPSDSSYREQYLKTAEQNFQDLQKSGYYFSYENRQPREYNGFNFPFRFLLRKRDKGI